MLKPIIQPSICAVIFSGKLLNGFDAPNVDGLRQKTSLTETQISQLLAFAAYKQPLIIKDGLSKETAQRYIDLLKIAGLDARIELVKPEAPLHTFMDAQGVKLIDRRHGERRGAKQSRRNQERNSAIQPDRREKERRKKP